MRMNSTYIESHGLSPSVMDYLDFNVPLGLFPRTRNNCNDCNIQESLVKALFTHHFFSPTIGAYDYAAIGYGYARREPDGNASTGRGATTPTTTTESNSLFLRYAEEASENPGGFATDEDDPSASGLDPYNNLVRGGCLFVLGSSLCVVAFCVVSS